MKSARVGIQTELTAQPNQRYMRYFLQYLMALATQLSCQSPADQSSTPLPQARTVSEIGLPSGLHRNMLDTGSFGQWLRNHKLKSDKIVRLFDGRVRSRQEAVYAVLEMKTGTRDLQQCADAIIRLRAEYLFEKGEWAAISFLSTSGQQMRFADWCEGKRFRVKGQRLEAWQAMPKSPPSLKQLDQWLEFVFTYAGTWSLQQQLRPRQTGSRLQPGDVIVEGGFPGHAMLVIDVAENAEGKEFFMLAQSYMPAQDMHIVVNSNDAGNSPWYERESGSLATPDWVFNSTRFFTWP